MKKVLALGFFDCIHIGHRFLLENGKLVAEKRGDPFVVTTFDDNFLALVQRPIEEIFLLSERKGILRDLGIDNVLVFPTDRSFFQMEKEDFCRYIEKIDISAIICGTDYRYARNAEGDIEFLREYFLPKGIEVIACDLVRENGEKVSTKTIKETLKRGEIEQANALLTCPFYYEGMVREGRKDGGKMGIPTLNIDVPNGKIKVKSGVYVTKTVIDGTSFLSVTNVGQHPTFCDEKFNIETHIIGKDVGDVYGKKVRIFFGKYIREIISFPDKTKLIEQITKDIAVAKAEDKW